MTIRQKFGTLDPVLYWECAHGHLVLLPYSGMQDPDGGCLHTSPMGTRCSAQVEKRGADTLVAIDRLQERLLTQERERAEREQQLTAESYAAITSHIRDNLYSKVVSADTTEFEKAFIREYLRCRQELRGRHRQRFEEAAMYLYAREMDLHGRSGGEEVWKG